MHRPGVVVIVLALLSALALAGTPSASLLCWKTANDALWFAHRACARDATCRFAVRPPHIVVVSSSSSSPAWGSDSGGGEHPLWRLYDAYLQAVREYPWSAGGVLGGPAIDALPLAWRSAPAAYAKIVWWHGELCNETGAATVADTDEHWLALLRQYAPPVTAHLVAAYVARAGLLTAGSPYCANGMAGSEAVLRVADGGAGGSVLAGVDCICPAGHRCGGGSNESGTLTASAATPLTGVDDTNDESEVPLSEQPLEVQLGIVVLCLLAFCILAIVLVVAYLSWTVYHALRRYYRRRHRHRPRQQQQQQRGYPPQF